MMKEYYPADYEKLKQYVANGRWFPAGSSMEESDVNSPSAESIFRQILYGNDLFPPRIRQSQRGIYAAGLFRFPGVAAEHSCARGHQGILDAKTFAGDLRLPVGRAPTRENTPVGIPFNVGLWEGPDGHGVIAAFNPGSYSADLTYDISKSSTASARELRGLAAPRRSATARSAALHRLSLLRHRRHRRLTARALRRNCWKPSSRRAWESCPHLRCPAAAAARRSRRPRLPIPRSELVMARCTCSPQMPSRCSWIFLPLRTSAHAALHGRTGIDESLRGLAHLGNGPQALESPE